jgi:uncharacterized protein
VKWLAAAAAAVGISSAPLGVASVGFDVKAHYEKSEHRVPMRDGTHLFTAVYRPKDRSRTFPILIVRTPYSIDHYGPDAFPPAAEMAPSEDFLRDGYIFVFQDARGTHRSEGEWEDFRPFADRRKDRKAIDERTDAYDSIEWLIRNVAGNNGRVGQWGISYPGWYTVQSMLEPHPALKAVSPQATTGDAFIGDDFHHNGAFILTGLMWSERMTRAAEGRKHPSYEQPPKIDFGTPWSYEFFLEAGPTDELNAKYFNGRLMKTWSDFIEHPDYDDYWRKRNAIEPLKNIKVPVLNVGGWFDEFDLYGTFETYRGIEKRNPRNRSTLVIGPWRHGGWHEDDGATLGDIAFGSKTSEYFQKNVVFPFFQHYLKGEGKWSPAEAIVFETGRNEWRQLAQWPPKTTPRNLYLHAGGRLSFDTPADAGHDEYISDPARPVPYTTEISLEEGYKWIVADQRYAYSRPDVVSYQTDVLEEDVTIAGPIAAKLFVSTTGTDSDWFVKIIDVIPETGYQMLLGYEVMRGKYRESFSAPSPMKPGEVTPVSFNIWDKFHTFRKGHRIMVQVHSSWFPFFDRNPQVFTNIYRAKPADYRKATQKVHRSPEAATHLVLPVVQ